MEEKQNRRIIAELAEIRRQNGLFTPVADLIHDLEEGHTPFRTPALRMVQTLSEVIEIMRPIEVCYEPSTGRVCTAFP